MRDRQRVIRKLGKPAKIRCTIQQELVTDVLYRDWHTDHSQTMWPEDSPWTYVQKFPGWVLTKAEFMRDMVNKLPSRSQRQRIRTLGYETRDITMAPCFHSENELNPVSLKVEMQFDPPVSDVQTWTYDLDDPKKRYWVRNVLTTCGGVLVDLGTFSPEGFVTDSVWDPLGIRTFTPPGLNLARRNAVENLLTVMSSGFQLPLFLKELADVKEILVKAKALLWAIIHFPAAGLLIMRYLAGRISWNELANNHLMVQFGLLPLVSDARNLWKALTTASEKFEKLLLGQNKLLCGHCQEVLHLTEEYCQKGDLVYRFNTEDKTFPFVRVWDASTGHILKGYVNVPWIDRVMPETAKYHLTAWYSYSLPTQWLGLAAVFATLDSVGVSPGQVSQWWQAIPFSFIADWFANVSSALRALDEPNLEVVVSIYDVCESVQCRVQKQLDPDYEPFIHMDMCGPHPQTLLDKLKPVVHQPPGAFLIRGELYNRRVSHGLPLIRGEFGLPNGMQWTSAGALILQFTTGGRVT